MPLRKTRNRIFLLVCFTLSLNLPLQAQGQYVTTKWEERKKLERGWLYVGYGEQIRASDYLECTGSVLASIVAGNPSPAAAWLKNFITRQITTLIDSARREGIEVSRTIIAQAIRGQGQKFQIQQLNKIIEVDIGLATYKNKQVIAGIDFKQPNEYQIYFRYRFNVGVTVSNGNPTYEVLITTGDMEKAGSNARVYIALIGDRGQTDNLWIDPPGNSWEQGQTDVQRLDNIDIGELRKIRIGHDNRNQDPGWNVKTIIVRNLRTGKTWEFPCNCWLADSHNTHSTFTASGLTIRGHSREGNVTIR